MTSRAERSWFNMIRGGSTMTWEAWDAQFKPNLTWNHAWGAAPGNIIARYLVGVAPLAPGYEKIAIAPQPGALTSFDAKIPTARGPVKVRYRKAESRLEFEVPVDATVTLPPAMNVTAGILTLDGKMSPTEKVYQVKAGRHVFAVGFAKSLPARRVNSLS